MMLPVVKSIVVVEKGWRKHDQAIATIDRRKAIGAMYINSSSFGSAIDMVVFLGLRRVMTRERGSDRTFADVADPGHRECREAGNPVQGGSRHGPGADGAEVDAACGARREVRERNAPGDERQRQEPYDAHHAHSDPSPENSLVHTNNITHTTAQEFAARLARIRPGAADSAV